MSQIPIKLDNLDVKKSLAQLDKINADTALRLGILYFRYNLRGEKGLLWGEADKEAKTENADAEKLEKLQSYLNVTQGKDAFSLVQDPKLQATALRLQRASGLNYNYARQFSDELLRDIEKQGVKRATVLVIEEYVTMNYSEEFKTMYVSNVHYRAYFKGKDKAYVKQLNSLVLQSPYNIKERERWLSEILVGVANVGKKGGEKKQEDEVEWISQFDCDKIKKVMGEIGCSCLPVGAQNPSNNCCNQACRAILKNHHNTEMTGKRIIVVKTNLDDNCKTESDPTNFSRGIATLNQSLQNNKPVMVGVQKIAKNARGVYNRFFCSKYDNDPKSAQHYIIIVGKFGDAYRYYEVGRGIANKAAATSMANLLYLQDDLLETLGDSKVKYRVTDIRENK